MEQVFSIDDICFLRDGTLYSPSSIVSGITEERIRELSVLTPDNTYEIPLNGFYFRYADEIVLIDTGAGNTMQPTLGHLTKSIAGVGLSPEDFSLVILTHLHPDHANGLLDADLKPVYPNARLVVPQAELDYWLSPPQAEEPDNVTRNRKRVPLNLAPYKDRMIAVNDGDEVVGLTAETAAGHTPGHTVWVGEAQGQRFVFWGDVVHLAAIQIPYPEAAVVYDLDGPAASVTRKALFDRMIAEDVVVFGAHLPAPGRGKIVRDGDRYAFMPL